MGVHEAQLRPQSVSTQNLIEAYYTICPVFVASNIAVELGWLDEEFKRAGAKATYLRSLSDNVGWIPHYRHSIDSLFRDGGAIPTIWAKADLADTTLIATTFAQTGGQILVSAGSNIRRVADLRGQRIGLVRSNNAEKIDFARASAEHSVLLALRLAGLNENDVQIVYLDDPDARSFQPASRPVELWSQYNLPRATDTLDIQALQEGRIDAIHANAGRAKTLVASGACTVIENLADHPDWTLQLANGPYTTAVNTDFAKAHPEVIVAFLRAAIRAGRWVNANQQAAAEIFARVTTYRDPALIAQLIASYDFVPTLSAKNLAGLTLLKDFLRERGYVKADFSITDWADTRYLNEALRSL